MTSTDTKPGPAGTSANRANPRSSTGSRTVNAIFSVIVGVAAITLAEIAASQGWVSPLVLPAPSAVAKALYDGLMHGDYFEQMVATTVAAAMGLVLAVLVAIVAAACFAMWPRAERVLLPYLVAFQSLPKVAVAPLVILWLGFGLSAKLAVIVTVCFFPLFVNALEGFRVQETEHVQLLQSLGASRWQTFYMLKFPSAIPYLFAGMKVAVIFALVGAVVAEFVGSRAGLGYIMLREQSSFNLPGTFAVMFLMLVVGLVFHFTMQAVQRSSGYWGRRGNETKL